MTTLSSRANAPPRPRNQDLWHFCHKSQPPCRRNQSWASKRSVHANTGWHMPAVPPSRADDSAGTAGRREDATAHAVAAAAGVSRIMVSRAFNPNASIRADKREHILQVANTLGY